MNVLGWLKAHRPAIEHIAIAGAGAVVAYAFYQQYAEEQAASAAATAAYIPAPGDVAPPFLNFSSSFSNLLTNANGQLVVAQPDGSEVLAGTNTVVLGPSSNSTPPADTSGELVSSPAQLQLLISMLTGTPASPSDTATAASLPPYMQQLLGLGQANQATTGAGAQS